LFMSHYLLPIAHHHFTCAQAKVEFA